MNLNTLRYAKLRNLGEAVGDWEDMVRKLKELSIDARDNLKGMAHKANWAGLNSQVSREFIDKTAGEFQDAHTEANTIARILRDTFDELTKYHSQLLDVIDRAEKKNLTVMDIGDGDFVVTHGTRPAGFFAGSHGQDPDQSDIDNFTDEIKHILSHATISDDTASEALRLIVDQAKYGFSDAKYKDRDSAAEAIKAAKKISELLKKDPHGLTSTELDQLNHTLAKYHNDPIFAERFAEGAGPKRILDFWAGVAAPGQFGSQPRTDKQLKVLQKNLGLTLATATLSDSSNMKSWETRMVTLSSRRLDTGDVGNPYGFQIMSNLMRFGKYDDQFLDSYGDKLLSFDKAHNNNWGKGLNFWVNGTNQSRFNYWGENDQGRDPVTGFLQALGHNPEASTEFFAQPANVHGSVNHDSEVNENLKYLTKDRNWAADVGRDGDEKFIAGRDSLGHALEAAATGYSYDVTLPHDGKTIAAVDGDHRNAKTANVMEQMTYLYGCQEGAQRLRGQPELADSLGKMAASYVDDINYYISGAGESSFDGRHFPAAYPGRANLTGDGAAQLIAVLGQNETSHSIVSSAQHLYTLSVLDAHPPVDRESYLYGNAAMTTEAETRGILDESRVAQATADYKKEAEDANKSLGRSAEWMKLGAQTLVGGGIAALPVPGSIVAGVAIGPVAGEKLGEVANTFVGQWIDKGVDDREVKPDDKIGMTEHDFYKAGAGQLGKVQEKYLDEYERNCGNYSQRSIDVTQLEGTYRGHGSNEGEQVGIKPTEDEE